MIVMGEVDSQVPSSVEDDIKKAFNEERMTPWD